MMAPAVCPDSEDEDDELFANDVATHENTFSSWAAKQVVEANLFGDSPEPLPFDGTREQLADLSTAELPIQMAGTHRTPFNRVSGDGSTKTSRAQSLYTPASGTAMKRHATSNAPDSLHSPAKATKRTKTYGSGSQSSRAFPNTADAKWAEFRDDNDMRFSDHSAGMHTSSGVPAGTIQQHFVNHEPAFMFRDTGDTVPFNDSFHEQMVEQALNDSARRTTDAAYTNTMQQDLRQSSPFPWPTSAHATQSSETCQSGVHQGKSTFDEYGATTDEHGQDDRVEPPLSQQNGFLRDHGSPVAPIQVTAESEVTKQLAKIASPTKSSPIVAISRSDAITTCLSGVALNSDQNAQTQKSARGRKRKSDGVAPTTEPMDSDHENIGLPREQYVPRPSRRRTTAALGEPIDYSVVPEKAARKRRKTAHGSLVSGEPQSTAVQVSLDAPLLQPAELDEAKDEETEEIIRPPPPAAKGTRKSLTKPANAERTSENPQPTSVPDKPSQDEISMPPPSLPASASRKRVRAKTTIYEDLASTVKLHKSPSLKEQQESRKSALREVSGQPIRKIEPKRRSIVQEGEDDEDELSRAEKPAEDETAPTKSGRRRPAKVVPANKIRPVEKLLEDSEEEPDELDDEAGEPVKRTSRQAKATVGKTTISSKRVLEDSEAEEDDFEEEEEREKPPKKKARGRPPKVKAPDPPTAAPEPQVEKVGLASSDLITLEDSESSPIRSALQRKDSNRQINIEREKKSTASPPQELAKELPPTPLELSGPAHSPIKSSSGVQLRVGLSKRTRIPPLLKIHRPPPKPSAR